MKKLAMFLVAAMLIGTAAQAAVFAYQQSINVQDTGWTATYVMNLTAHTQSNTGWKSGSYSTSYALVYNAWLGLYVYDDSYGAFDELIYIWNQNL